MAPPSRESSLATIPGAARPDGASQQATKLTAGPSGSRAELARDLSLQGKSSAVSAPEPIHLAARALVARFEAAERAARHDVFTQHLQDITKLIRESEGKISDLDDELERLTGFRLRDSLRRLQSDASGKYSSLRRDATLGARIEIETRSIEGSLGTTARTKAWAKVLQSEFITPALAAKTPAERSRSIGDLERALFSLHAESRSGKRDFSPIDILLEIKSSTGEDVLANLHKSASAQELALIHAIVLESGPRIEAIQFVRALERSKSLADIVSFLPDLDSLNDFERELKDLTGSATTDLLMAQSLTLRGDAAVGKDEALFQAELTVVQAVYSKEARQRIHADGIAQLVREKSEQLESARDQTLDTQVLRAQEVLVREAAAREGILRSLQQSMVHLADGPVQSDDMDARGLSALLHVREATVQLKSASLGSGLNLDPAFTLRNSAAFAKFENLASEVKTKASAEFEQRLLDIPEGYLREQYLRIASEVLSDEQLPLDDALHELSQQFSAKAAEIALASTLSELIDLKTQLEGASKLSAPERFSLIARIHSQPPEIRAAFESHLDAAGDTLEKLMRTLGGEDLLAFARATTVGDRALCSAIVLQQLLKTAQVSDALSLLASYDKETKGKVAEAFERHYDSTLIAAFPNIDNAQQHVNLLLSGGALNNSSSIAEAALGRTGGPLDISLLNETLANLSTTERLALMQRLSLPEKRTELLAELTRSAQGDATLAELAISLLEAGPQPRAQIEEARQFLKQRAERDALRREAEELLEKRLEQNERLRQGTLANVRSASAPIDDQNILVRGWCRLTGVTGSANRDAENSRTLAREYEAQRLEILKARDDARAVASKAKEAEDQVLNALAFGRQQAALDAAQRANKGFSDLVDIMESKRARSIPDLSRYQKEMKGVMRDLDSSLSSIDHWETGLKVTRTAVIVVGGAAVVFATGGAALPAWQAALLIAAAATPGTIVQGGMDVHYGNKDVKEALIDSALQVGSDFLGAYGGNQIGQGLAKLASKGFTPKELFKVKQILSDFKFLNAEGKTIILKKGLTITEKALEQILKGSNFAPLTKTFIPVLAKHAGAATGAGALVVSGVVTLRKEISSLLSPNEESRKKKAGDSSGKNPPYTPTIPIDIEGSEEKKREKTSKRAPLAKDAGAAETPPPQPAQNPIVPGEVKAPPPPGDSPGAAEEPRVPATAGRRTRKARVPSDAPPPAPPPIIPPGPATPSYTSRGPATPGSPPPSGSSGGPALEDFRPKQTAVREQDKEAAATGSDSHNRNSLEVAYKPNRDPQQLSQAIPATAALPLQATSIQPLGMEHERDVLQRKVAAELGERELERIRFNRQSGASALEQVQAMAQIQKRWVEELQAEVLRQFALAAARHQASTLQEKKAAQVANASATQHAHTIASRLDLQRSLGVSANENSIAAAIPLSNQTLEARLSASELQRAEASLSLASPNANTTLLAPNASISIEKSALNATLASELQRAEASLSLASHSAITSILTHSAITSTEKSTLSATLASELQQGTEAVNRSVRHQARSRMNDQRMIRAFARVDAEQASETAPAEPRLRLMQSTFLPTARPLAIEVARSIERVSHQQFLSQPSGIRHVPAEIKIMLSELRTAPAALPGQTQPLDPRAAQLLSKAAPQQPPTELVRQPTLFPVYQAMEGQPKSAPLSNTQQTAASLVAEAQVIATSMNRESELIAEAQRIAAEASELTEQEAATEERRVRNRKKRLKKKHMAHVAAQKSARRLLNQIAEEALSAESEDELDETVVKALKTLRIARRRPIARPPAMARTLPRKPISRERRSSDPSQVPQRRKQSSNAREGSRAELYRKHITRRT